MNANATHERIAIATAAFCIVICVVIVSLPYHGAPWQKIARGDIPQLMCLGSYLLIPSPMSFKFHVASSASAPAGTVSMDKST